METPCERCRCLSSHVQLEKTVMEVVVHQAPPRVGATGGVVVGLAALSASLVRTFPRGGGAR
jgi:hypothetical protein